LSRWYQRAERPEERLLLGAITEIATAWPAHVALHQNSDIGLESLTGGQWRGAMWAVSVMDVRTFLVPGSGGTEIVTDDYGRLRLEWRA
jgi:hypothetical protein